VPRRKTLLRYTGQIMAVSMLTFLLFSSGVIVYYILVPMARQASGDLAALIVLSAQTWVELPPDTRPDFEDELYLQHGLSLVSAEAQLKPVRYKSPYLRFLETALSRRLGQEIQLLDGGTADDWAWVDVPMAERTVRIGFSSKHNDASPPLAVLLLLLGGSMITLISSLLLVRRQTYSLAQLASATSRFGRGERPESLPEEGPEELAVLARNFNRMTGQVQQLLTNRTTLLGGISHDLRTPIARLQLALALLDEKSEPELINGMREDLQEMDLLIRRTLELARGLEGAPQDEQLLDLAAFLAEVVADYRQQPVAIEWADPPPCPMRFSPLALRRVLSNLLGNGLQYGDGKPLEVRLQCDGAMAEIQILDRGAGIPEAQLEAVFQPFFRLEGSRNPATGGSGLGLAIVRQLCDLYGWQIQLVPRQGGGTKACLSLPNSRSEKNSH